MRRFILKAGLLATALYLFVSCKVDSGASVSIDSVRVYIDELVSFHTRHTLSSQGSPK